MDITFQDLLISGQNRVFEYVEFQVQAKKEFFLKNKKYGASWICYRPQTIWRRNWNKGLRIRSIQDKAGIQFVGDPIEDELKAIYNSSILGMIITDRATREGLDTVNQIDTSEEIDAEVLYVEAQEKCFLLMKQKDHDYNGAWVTMTIADIIDEIMTKLFRAKTILDNRADIPPEELKKLLNEIWMDVANYAAFGFILILKGIDPLKF